MVEIEFTPYEMAKAMMGIGFNEPCLGGYLIADWGQFCLYGIDTNHTTLQKCSDDDWLNAPLYQQMFRWFVENYGLEGHIHVADRGKGTWYWNISGGKENVLYANSYKNYFDWDSEDYNSFGEAQYECYMKMIEIVRTVIDNNTKFWG